MSVFINTRPTERAKPLSQLLRQAGMTVVDLPLLQMIPLALSVDDKQVIKDLLAGCYDIVVAVSPTAVTLACQSIHSIQSGNSSADDNHHSVDSALHALSSCQVVVAVGQVTADKLAEFDISAIVPHTANNEGMLALECIQRLDSRNRVLVWRGQGGRKLLIEDLQQRGIQVDVLELYQRQLPSLTSENFVQYSKQINARLELRQDMPSNPFATVLISSGEAFDNWRQLIASQAMVTLNNFEYVVLGERLAQKLEKLELSQQTVADLQPMTILSAIQPNKTHRQLS